MTAQARTLCAPVDNFDQVNTFKIEISNARRTATRTAYLFDSDKEGKVYVMLASVSLKANYTAADTAERDRLAAEAPVRNGDRVTYNGKPYEVRILGEYSDAGYLIAL